MRRAFFVAGASLALAAALWPEVAAYRAERQLADANARLAAALRGAATPASVQAALVDARAAMAATPGDPRAPLSASIALLLLRRAEEAKVVLEHAIASGERPELTLNLGRARGTLGDEAGAQAAFLRTAWASPAAIATLPSALRARVLERVGELEAELRDGRLDRPPPLD
ncbi:hypothetical protein [Dokdonella fugitiva]|jgi:hypothetical protein|uniref:MxaK protein n=1 Tax=Dokdonella fugitiva TaxID=328517 RepID=A0A4R2IEQ6_9GAMM|nr:hypothetical protein [Dokdonella fugitiva]TCO43171.1 hypothetical protein EV148_101590 [Dokdonella fugitiva]